MAFVSIDNQIQEAADELRRRQKIYPELVSSGRMRLEEAQVREERMVAILYTLRWLKHIEPRLKNGYIEKPQGDKA